MNYDEREILKQYINRIEDKVNKLVMKIEHNEDISQEEWEEFEEEHTQIHRLIQMIRDEII